MEPEKALEHIHEELHDIHEYIALWHETGNGIYKDIAMEEMTHAKVLKEIADAHGWNTEQISAEWMQAEEMMHKQH